MEIYIALSENSTQLIRLFTKVQKRIEILFEQVSILKKNIKLIDIIYYQNNNINATTINET